MGLDMRFRSRHALAVSSILAFHCYRPWRRSVGGLGGQHMDAGRLAWHASKCGGRADGARRCRSCPSSISAALRPPREQASHARRSLFQCPKFSLIACFESGAHVCAVRCSSCIGAVHCIARLIPSAA